jgi:ArsR family metal-binding transcriptional regulator
MLKNNVEMETKQIKSAIDSLPLLNCGACGQKTCEDFAHEVDLGVESLKKCIHIADKLEKQSEDSKACFMCNREGLGMGEKLEWKDNLGRDFDFILD